MRVKSTLSIPICLSTMLLVIVVLLLGCASQSSTPQAPSDLTTVRQPKGNPETFWNKLNC
jgi:hypothetical protein